MQQSEEFKFEIPEDLLKKFGKQARLVVRPGPIAGIILADAELLKKLETGALKNFDVIIAPKKS